jgi:NNP family nitrate/nitrite transporter-like MFS transporter
LPSGPGKWFSLRLWLDLANSASRYAFSPLLSKTIKKDLNLTQNEIANGNILALTATLLVRFVAGPLCDKFGPRKVFAGLLLVGSIPTALAGTVKNATGLTILRFFVGILGGTFVPCQVWSTGFFDKNVVGTSNALIGGWGNAGGGITYFAMPAIFDSLVNNQHLTPHVAWRVSFIVPFILIVSTAIGMLVLCEDTPTGPWADRFNKLNEGIEESHRQGVIVASAAGHPHDIPTPTQNKIASSKNEKESLDPTDSEAQVEAGEVVIISEYQHEAVVNPSAAEILKVLVSPQTLTLAMTYFNSFGGELAINAILGAYYLKNFPDLGQTNTGRWAAMFGLLNVITRPLGGIVGDLVYKYTDGSLWAKKIWIHFVGIISGAFCIALGLTDPHNLAKMIGLVVGIAFFMEMGNGANFALVPHVHPHANGVLSGIVGASGNFGGVIFAIIFRYSGLNYHKGIWIIGVFCIAFNVLTCWIRPIPKSQIGGR